MFEIGDKVVPVGKPLFDGPLNNSIWKKAIANGQPYLYVIDYCEKVNYGIGEYYVVSHHKDDITGDFFYDENLRAYTNKAISPEDFYKGVFNNE